MKRLYLASSFKSKLKNRQHKANSDHIMLPLKRKTMKKERINIKTHAINWMRHAQFHGATRLAESYSSCCWIPMMAFLLIFAIVLAYLATIRYLENPTYILQTESGHSILPFPSAVICPGVNFRTAKKNEFLSKMKYPEGLNRSYISQVLPQLSAFIAPEVRYNTSDLVNLEQTLLYNKMDVETAIIRLTETCDEILIRCRWMGERIKCAEIFHMEVTLHGFCCVFNGRSLRRELQQKTNKNDNKPQLMITSFGFSSGLVVALDQSQKPRSIDLSYKWIDLQEGQYFVDASNNGSVLLNRAHEHWIAYYVKSTHVTDGVRGLGSTLRKCSLSAEKLTYFPYYRRRYCLLECEMYLSTKHCHCVRLGLPRPNGVSYCNARRLKCAMKFKRLDPGFCHCLPTCDLEDTLVKSSAFALASTVPVINDFYKGLDFEKVTIVRVFVQKRIIKSNQRTAYYTYVDLFSQLGGLFNLFFGCSVLTILGLLQLLCRITATLYTRLRNKIQTMRQTISATG